MDHFSVTGNLSVPRSVPFTVAQDSVLIPCSEFAQQKKSPLTHSCGRTPRCAEPTEDCWATVNGSLLGNRELLSTEKRSIHGSSRLRLDSVQRIRSAKKIASDTLLRPYSALPRATEDCWATVNGSLLGNRELLSTEKRSIHGSSRLRLDSGQRIRPAKRNRL